MVSARGCWLCVSDCCPFFQLFYFCSEDPWTSTIILKLKQNIKDKTPIWYKRVCIDSYYKMRIFSRAKRKKLPFQFCFLWKRKSIEPTVLVKYISIKYELNFSRIKIIALTLVWLQTNSDLDNITKNPMQKYALRVKCGKTRIHFWLDFCNYQIGLQHASQTFEYHIFNQNGALSTVSVELSFVEDGVSSRPRE